MPFSVVSIGKDDEDCELELVLDMVTPRMIPLPYQPYP
jgi:hypothetical protein